MTFKHVNFYDSPVMRELERQAVKKGTFKSKPVDEVVKTASPRKSFVPTDDLQSDLLKLAEGLRERGFVKEADDLESKIFIRKQAETHLYRAIDEDGEDILEFAHPDGDARVADAQNQEGVVETLLSQHKKIEDIVNKLPTGKYAKLIDNVILATADVLDVDLVKMAAGEEDADEELLTGAPGKKKASIQAANQFIKENATKISALLKDGIAEFHPENWQFSEEGLVNPAKPDYINAYVKYSKTNPSDLARWTKLAQTFGNVANVDQTVSDYITKNARSGGLAAWANQIQAGLGNYFTGSQPSGEKKQITALANGDPEGILAKIFTPSQDSVNAARAAVTAPWFADNANSILKVTYSAPYNIGTEVDYQKVAEATKAISQAIVNFHNSVLGQDKLAAASAAFANDGKAYFDGLQKAVEFYDAAPEIPEDATSFLNVVQPLTDMSDYLKRFAAGGSDAKNLSKLIQTGGWSWEPKAFGAAAEGIKVNRGIIDHLNKNALSTNDVIVNDDTAASLFLNTAKMYHAALQSNKNPQVAAKYKKYMRSTLQLYKLLSGAKGKPFSEIAGQVKKMYPKANSYDKLVQEAQTWANESAAMTGQQPPEQSVANASAKSGITKKAAPPGEVAENAPGAQAPGKGTGSGGTSSAEVQAVKLMQDAMNSLGQYLEQAGNVDRGELIKLRNSGQGPNTVSGDGIWGSRTTAALQTANKLFSSNLVVNRNPATATKDAQSNYSVLQQLLQTYGKGGGAAGASDMTVFDQLPQQIDWNSMPETATFEGGQIKLTGRDLSTLNSLYDFLTKNRLMQLTTSGASETSIGREGIALGDLARSLQWFQRRAVFKYNSVKDQTGLEDAKNTAKLYYQKVNDLMQQYVAYTRSINPALNGLDAQGIDRFVVTKESLQQIGAQNGRAGDGSAGSTYQQQKGKGRGKPGQGGAGDSGMEGSRTRMPGGGGAQDNSPPITDIVDLSRSEWFDLPYDNLESPRLRLSDFQRVPGPRMAQAMFSSDSMDDQKSQKQVLDFMGFTPYVLGWNKDLNSYVVKSRDGGRILAQDIPGFKETMGQVLARSSTQQYQQFLNQLSKQLHDTYSNWSQNVSAGEDSAMKDYYTRWQQAIAKQYRDITKRRG
ncbi:MAG TPA: hypothetical protein VM577_14145 [Anaerovoracaceae bacterium]|nr:hypothetical protein [Anaerovoracaceae bacterium]